MLQPYNKVCQPYASNWLNENGLTEKDMEATIPPSLEECKNSELEAIYMSYFVPWNSSYNYEVAKLWGFRHLGNEYTREGSIDNYDQIDSLSYLVNPFLKYVKFGHSIATDNASRWVRYGIKTREEMIPIVEEKDSKLDQGMVDLFCEFTRMSRREFYEILDKWYNSELFEKDDHSVWHPKFKVGVG